MRINEITRQGRRLQQRLGNIASAATPEPEVGEETFYDRAKAELEQQGYQHVGSGGYGTVYSNGRSVAKVFIYDRCYMHFAQWCRKTPGDPHLPRISRIQRFSGAPADCGIAYMEHLEPLMGTRWEILAMQNLMASLMGDVGTLEDPYAQDMVERLGHHQPSMHDTIARMVEQMRPVMASGRCHEDLTHHNVMLRGNTLVIVDPYASS